MVPEKKLRRARTMLILGEGDEPFFGSVALSLDLIESPGCATAATDGKCMIYNPDWIKDLTIEEVMALFEHEVYHVALKHGQLMLDLMEEPDFDMGLAQRACDIPIDNRLITKGRKLPVTPDGFVHKFEKEFEGMSAIRIYRKLQEQKKKQPPPPDEDGEGAGGEGDGTSSGNIKSKKKKIKSKKQSKDGDTSPDVQEEFEKETGGFGGIMPLKSEENPGEMATPEEVKQFEKDFDQKIANAGRILQKELESTIGDMPEFIQEIIEAHTEPQRTYKDLITDVLEEITRDDYCMGRPNRKYMDDVYLPSLYVKELNTIAVIVDTSGSITQGELETYASELSGILEEFEGFEIAVIFHNTYAYLTEFYSSEDLPIKFDKTQSGGTDYKDAYIKAAELEDEPVVIFHFTDLDVTNWAYPPNRPNAQVFWMNTTPRMPGGRLRYSTPPWGEVIDLEVK